MKKKLLIIFILVLTALSFVTCNDPVFYLISQEIPRVTPLVRGSPTDFVVFNDNMYIASGRNLHYYKFNDPDSIRNNWNRISLNDNIIAIAATDKYLYALTFRDRSDEIETRLIRTEAPDKAESWNGVPADGYIDYIFHTVYSVNDTLYIGAQTDAGAFTILKLSDNDSAIAPTGITSGNTSAFPRGVAFNGTNTFICTNGGIYICGSYTLIPGTTDFNFMGITNLPDNTVVAIARNRSENNEILYEITTSGATGRAKFPDSRNATGALAVWQDVDNPSVQLLLAGRQDMSYTTSTGFTFGYVELLLDAAGGITGGVDDNEFKVPGKVPGDTQPSTIEERSVYVSSLGRLPINAIFQAPSNVDEHRTLFASTQQDGVWSLREHPGRRDLHWNAEGGQ